MEWGDIVVISTDFNEQLKALLELYSNLAETEAAIADGAVGEDFFKVAKRIRRTVHGKV